MSSAKRYSVLIVDDEPELVMMLALRLRAAGLDVRSASDGEAGLASARSEPPDVVLTDLSMPGLDGWEVCSKLRGSGVPVLVMTAWATADVERRAQDAGAAGILLKPFDERRLAAAVRSLATSHGSAACRGS